MELNFERAKLSILCNKCSENSNNFEKIIQNKKINEKILLSPEVPLKLIEKIVLVNL